MDSPQLKAQVLVLTQEFGRDVHRRIEGFEQALRKLSPLASYSVGRELNNLRKRLDRLVQEVGAMPL